MASNIGEYRRREECRVCGSRNLNLFLDYGDMPLAGGFLLREQIPQEKVYPMDLAVCTDCSLVQILNVVSPDVLFTDYRYLSSVTQTLSQHFRDYAQMLRSDVLPRENPMVVEFGCNDGVLLVPLKELGVRTVGVDAADNVVEVARKRGIEVIYGYFGPDTVSRIIETHGQTDVVTASNVFAHIDDLDEVMKGVDLVLKPEGTFIVEVHYALDLLKTFQFDTVYHEHLCYYSLHALQALYRRFGFRLTDVQHLPMHGGAIRVFAQRESVASEGTKRLRSMWAEEEAMRINDPALYAEFGEKVVKYRDRLVEFIHGRKKKGRSISAYGAAGRSTILFNYCGFGPDLIDYVVDESPFRAGRYVPGVHIPIVPREHFHAHPTDDCLITAWNYREEIVGKEPEFRQRGGKFITPLPTIEVLD